MTSTFDCPICAEQFTVESKANVHINLCIDSSTQTVTVKRQRQPAMEMSPMIKVRKIQYVDRIQVPQFISSSAESMEVFSYSDKMPSYKVLDGLPNVAVDAFAYGVIPGVDFYFLTHSHSDHYTRLNGQFQAKVYCSRVTAQFVKLKLGVQDVFEMDLHTEYQLTPRLTVELIDANHCPGAVLLLFVVDQQRRILHTGDFRFHQLHLQHFGMSRSLDVVYLDTTYCKPQYAFPPQEQVLQEVAYLAGVIKEHDSADEKSDLSSILASLQLAHAPLSKRNKWTQKDPKQRSISFFFNSKQQLSEKQQYQTLILIGTYTIGKERVFTVLAKALNTLVYVTEDKYDLLNSLGDEKLSALITRDASKAQVHVVSMQQLRSDFIDEYMSLHPQYARCIAIRPTGWVFKDSNKQSTIITPIHVAKNLKLSILGVPYSEHSSFSELEQFVKGVCNQKTLVIPTVPTKGAEEQIVKWQNEQQD